MLISPPHLVLLLASALFVCAALLWTAARRDRDLGHVLRAADAVVEPHFYACFLHSQSLGIRLTLKPSDYKRLRDSSEPSGARMTLPRIGTP